MRPTRLPACSVAAHRLEVERHQHHRKAVVRRDDRQRDRQDHHDGRRHRAPDSLGGHRDDGERDLHRRRRHAERGDASATATGHLVNGSFSLPQPLTAKASSAAGTGRAYAPVGGSASPTTLLAYAGPASSDAVAVSFQQAIGATDALRTGAYSKTLAFTLSTTSP
jgi:hypothetical protein